MGVAQQYATQYVPCSQAQGLGVPPWCATLCGWWLAHQGAAGVGTMCAPHPPRVCGQQLPHARLALFAWRHAAAAPTPAQQHLHPGPCWGPSWWSQTVWVGLLAGGAQWGGLGVVGSTWLPHEGGARCQNGDGCARGCTGVPLAPKEHSNPSPSGGWPTKGLGGARCVLTMWGSAALVCVPVMPALRRTRHERCPTTVEWPRAPKELSQPLTPWRQHCWYPGSGGLQPSWPFIPGQGKPQLGYLSKVQTAAGGYAAGPSPAHWTMLLPNLLGPNNVGGGDADTMCAHTPGLCGGSPQPPVRPAPRARGHGRAAPRPAQQYIHQVLFCCPSWWPHTLWVVVLAVGCGGCGLWAWWGAACCGRRCRGRAGASRAGRESPLAQQPQWLGGLQGTAGGGAPCSTGLHHG